MVTDFQISGEIAIKETKTRITEKLTLTYNVKKYGKKVNREIGC